MRLQPDLSSPVVDLLEEGSYLMVLNEQGDFYSVAPLSGKKAFIYRPYVLDGRVEGSHVNVRLEPDVDAPVVTQLNTGDSVQGEVCAANPRWLEINMPENVQFYVAKEYLENIGGPELVTQRQKRQEEVNGLLQSAYLAGQKLLSHSQESSDLEDIEAQFARIRADYPDFPEYGSRADAVYQVVQQLYLEQKLAANKVGADQEMLVPLEVRLPSFDELAFGTHKEKVLEAPLRVVADLETVSPTASAHSAIERDFVTDKMLAWEPIEERFFEVWSMHHNQENRDAFYAEQMLDGVTLTGIIEAYDRPVRNRPGDFLLVNNNRPVAFLYSTRVNLEEKVGQQVTVRGLSRPNHHFAFPAYFVLGLE